MGYFGEGQEMVFSEPVFKREGSSMDGVLAGLDEIEKMDMDAMNGHVIFYATTLMDTLPAAELSKLANARFLKKNMLFREIAPGLQKMDQELKQMAREILGLSNDIRVNLTSGGSESLYCGINAAYQWAKEHKPNIKDPEIVVPYSIHAAVSKWCHYADIKIKRIPVGPDYRADVKAMENAITENTFLIAGSAPCWPYGLFDPIEELAALAERYNLWMHVDACIGGYQAPFVEKLTGNPFPKWRIGQVPGVSSMSADIHKHAYSAKPCSSIFFKNKDLQEFHWFHPSDWPSGPYDTEAMLGSFTAGSVASAWAVMKFLGEDGYLELAQKTLVARKRYVEGINSIKGLKAWDTDLSVLVFETGDIDAVSVISGFFERGIPILPIYQPMLIQLALDPVPVEVVDNFLKHLGEVVDGVKKGEITAEFLASVL
jgi:sphinganine-1-phosphate aldolase